MKSVSHALAELLVTWDFDCKQYYNRKNKINKIVKF